ncbi:MAG: chromosome segregation protein SMC [Burkholderiales bacterium]
MRLTHIKLSGFKSFVDPTHIAVPGQLVGVVGPNGCGKSNVIDAVRWVLGESSARQLRGENMQDVIFNGSGERKPVGRASVELIFDNSLGKATGPWSQYAEISVKRVLERSGDSSYFLNNLHVRRRDVSDLFLGTGLGGRGYAIIEQGMISRIIEAKPEDLRSFLEEAAGVSKYRERRRETELRLEDTRENLLRVEDVRRELSRQLEHLESQAEKAGRFREFEAARKTSQQLLWMLRKRDAAVQRARLAREVESVSVELEAESARLSDAQRRLEELRAGHFGASDGLHAAQGALYEVNAEVSRLEQQIQHLRESRQRAEQQLASLQGQLADQASRVEATEALRRESEQKLAVVMEGLLNIENARRVAGEELPAAEMADKLAQARFSEAQRGLDQADQQIRLEETRKGHAEKLLLQLGLRSTRLEEERDTLEVPNLSELVRLENEVGEAERDLALLRQALDAIEASEPELGRDLENGEAAAEIAQQRLNQLDARLTALQSLQEQVGRAGAVEPWLESRELRRNAHLWQGIRIRDGWEDALEAVLRERLNSIALDELSQSLSWFRDPPPGKVSFHLISTEGRTAEPVPPELVALMDYVTCTDPGLQSVLSDWLARVYVVMTPEQGFEQAKLLSPGAILVTSHGHVFTSTSVNFYGADSEVHGILSRQKEIETLFAERNDADHELAQRRAAAGEARIRFDEGRAEADRLRRKLAETQDLHHQRKLDHVRLAQLADRLKSRGEQIVAELLEIRAEVEREDTQLQEASLKMEALAAGTPDLQKGLEAASQARVAADLALQSSRDKLQRSDQEIHEARFNERTIRLKINELSDGLKVINENIVRLSNDRKNVETEIARGDERPHQEQLSLRLTERVERESTLKQARMALEEAEQVLRATEQERQAAEQKLDPLRNQIGELRLKEQEARLAEENFAAQLAESHAVEEELAPLMTEGLRPGKLQAEINRLNEDIAALGAVNLASLDELSSSRERKNYLDAQSEDLTQAVETLENAIRKIDRETRERLQTTFDAVNRHFGEMFPALFGGGEAKLLMTGEEILDAGVQVIARPPGKRNASIHLLSGGEKALTALSLVFSMFQLNPAPFCLLDEVDAPLDDSNTERFCALVRRMADQTQFMFITHNKITMEMANQLIGVTMQEQGVSRVVAVDVEQAMRMREEAA